MTNKGVIREETQTKRAHIGVGSLRLVSRSTNGNVDAGNSINNLSDEYLLKHLKEQYARLMKEGQYFNAAVTARRLLKLGEAGAEELLLKAKNMLTEQMKAQGIPEITEKIAGYFD